MARQLFFLTATLSLLVAGAATATTVPSTTAEHEVVINDMSDLSIWESETGGTWNWTRALAERWIPSWQAQDPVQFDAAIVPLGSASVTPTTTTPPSLPPTSSTPEPTAGLLFAVGMTVVVAVRKRLA